MESYEGTGGGCTTCADLLEKCTLFGCLQLEVDEAMVLPIALTIMIYCEMYCYRTWLFSYRIGESVVLIRLPQTLRCMWEQMLVKSSLLTLQS